jgi:hypothetical protein
MVSGHMPKVKISPTTTRAIRRYLMRTASVFFSPSDYSDVVHFRDFLSCALEGERLEA